MRRRQGDKNSPKTATIAAYLNRGCSANGQICAQLVVGIAACIGGLQTSAGFW